MSVIYHVIIDLKKKKNSEDENITLPDKAGPDETGTVSSLQGSPPVSSHTPTPVVKKTPKKTLQLPSPPEYVIYTDTELELARSVALF